MQAHTHTPLRLKVLPHPPHAHFQAKQPLSLSSSEALLFLSLDLGGQECLASMVGHIALFLKPWASL